MLKTLVKPKQVEIKWPNDILIEGAKICGMLQESAFPSSGGQKRVVTGIGLNINQTNFPSGLRDRATSLKIITGLEYDRVEILASLLTRMEDAYHELHRGRGSVLRARYEANLNALGREVTFVNPADGAKASGVVTGIDSRGGLILATRAGRETILTGDVNLRME
jgi:BirA family biotin operon repressor/biotin-[acetyl-CoA-carboxylase] ligase